MAARLREQGVRVIDRPAHGEAAAELHRLADAQGTRLTAPTHESCPGQAAYIGQEYGWVPVDAAGQPKRAADCHDQDDEQDEQEDGDGVEVPRRAWTSWAAPRWVCTDPAAHGHTDLAGHGHTDRCATQGPSGGGGRMPVDHPDEKKREAAQPDRRAAT